MTTSQRDKNREKYPELAKFMDEMRAEFGEVKIVSLTPGFKDLEPRVDNEPMVRAPNYLLASEYESKSKKLNVKDRRAKEQMRLMAELIEKGLLKVGVSKDSN